MREGKRQRWLRWQWLFGLGTALRFEHQVGLGQDFFLPLAHHHRVDAMEVGDLADGLVAAYRFERHAP